MRFAIAGNRLSGAEKSATPIRIAKGSPEA